MNSNNLRVIALYLPQYHPFPENDEWWGKGFTEWTNVARAREQYRGHYQPHIPADLGFYDLRLPIVREQQAELAREAGIEGFCYWHYWFGNGKQLMNDIIDDVIATGKPNYPFCLGWANHSWYAKNWNITDSKGKDRLLIEQKYLGEKDYRLHYEYALRAFKDPRYIKEGNKPFFMIYNVADTPEGFIELWNKWAQEDGFDGIYFVGNIKSLAVIDKYKQMGFNALIVDRPGEMKSKIDKGIGSVSRNVVRFKMHVLKKFPFRFDYEKSISKIVVEEEDCREDLIPNLIPNFDHSPRSGKWGYILDKSTPKGFYKMCKKVVDIVRKKQNKFVMLRSWNEWGEGNHMEPDLKYGHGYIDALRKAIDGKEYE